MRPRRYSGEHARRRDGKGIERFSGGGDRRDFYRAMAVSLTKVDSEPRPSGYTKQKAKSGGGQCWGEAKKTPPFVRI